MKKVIISLIFALFLVNPVVNAQCKQQFVYSCAQKNGNAIYLRDFNVKFKRQKKKDEPNEQRFSVVLNKGTNYRFNICTPEDIEGQAVLSLFDDKGIKKNEFVASTCFKGKYYESFDFRCNKSAIYYVTIGMKDGEKGCAVGILSFVGKN